MKKWPLLLLSILCWYPLYPQEYLRMIETGTHTVFEIRNEAESYFAKVGTGRGSGFKQYKRWEHQALRHMDDNGRLKSTDANYNELERYQNYVNQTRQEGAVLQGNWEELGPINWNATASWGPGLGRAVAFAVDPTDHNHIITGSSTGGVWKTTDGGGSWVPLSDDMASMNVYALAMHPHNSNEYYWGSEDGVVFKSTDAGATWNVLGVAEDGRVHKILIDPNNTMKMYLASGVGLFKSVDAGATWERIHNAANWGYDVEFKPGDTNVIYASGNVLFKSIDGGATFDRLDSAIPGWEHEFIAGEDVVWKTATENQNGSVTPQSGNSMAYFYNQSPDPDITRLVSPPLDLSGASSAELSFAYSQVAWLNDQDYLQVLYKTSEGSDWIVLASYTTEAVNWTNITLSLPDVSSTYYIAFEGIGNYGRGVTLDNVVVTDPTLGVVFEDGFETIGGYAFESGLKMIAVSPDNPDIVYILEAKGGRFGAFYKSVDDGASFQQLDHGDNNYFGYSSTADDNGGQAPTHMDIVVNPTNVDEVHIAGVLTWKSTDGGANFDVTSQWIPSVAANENIGYCHADVLMMEYVDDRIFVGTDGGLFVANNPATVNADYYTDLSAGLGIKQFYKIGISQSDPCLVSGGAQDNGTSIRTANGTWYDWVGADGMETFIDKDNNDILYGTVQFGTLYKSLDGGITSFAIPRPDGKSGSWITPVEQDPIANNTLYIGYDQVYKSSDGAASWTPISQVFIRDLDHLKIAATDNNIMFAAFDNYLYKTTDGGATNWSSVSWPGGWINSIAIHPTNPDKIAIASTGDDKVFVSDDGGTTWNALLLDLPDFSAEAVVWEANGNNGLYVGMDYGIYYTDDTLNQWEPFSTNLPNVIISELEINTLTNEIYAATYGRGVWKSHVYNPALSLDAFQLAEVSVYPNPATDKINIQLPNADTVDIAIFDASGKVVYRTANVHAHTTIEIDVSEFASGLFFLRLSNAHGAITKKISKY